MCIRGCELDFFSKKHFSAPFYEVCVWVSFFEICSIFFVFDFAFFSSFQMLNNNIIIYLLIYLYILIYA